VRLVTFLVVAAAVLASIPAAAQSPVVEQAIQAGQVGERYDGYMGLPAASSPELRRQVSAINIRRRNLYIDLAQRRNVTAQLVGLATACELFARLSIGEAYMLEDGAWRRRAAGQPAPVPSYCR
jgi:uncharacterized protein YdbL (DUF1318 family)